MLMLGITQLFPHNELVHLPYIAVATNTRADQKVNFSCIAFFLQTSKFFDIVKIVLVLKNTVICWNF